MKLVGTIKAEGDVKVDAFGLAFFSATRGCFFSIGAALLFFWAPPAGLFAASR